MALLIEYEADGSTIKNQYLENGVLQEAYQFQPAKNDQLLPQSTNFTIANGLSSCYYYQQEMDATNQPMKTKAAVMLAMGLEYIDWTAVLLNTLAFSTSLSMVKDS